MFQQGTLWATSITLLIIFRFCKYDDNCTIHDDHDRVLGPLNDGCDYVHGILEFINIQ